MFHRLKGPGAIRGLFYEFILKKLNGISVGITFKWIVTGVLTCVITDSQQFTPHLFSQKAQQSAMLNHHVLLNTIIRKLHYLDGDSAAFMGGIAGGTVAFAKHINIAEWVSFSAHAVVGGVISYAVKKVADMLFSKYQSKEDQK